MYNLLFAEALEIRSRIDCNIIISHVANIPVSFCAYALFRHNSVRPSIRADKDGSELIFAGAKNVAPECVWRCPFAYIYPLYARPSRVHQYIEA